MKKKCTVLSFECGLSNAKISALATVSEKSKASVSAQNFDIAHTDAQVKDIFTSVANGLQGIFPSETNLVIGVKVVSTIRNKSAVNQCP